MTCQTVTADYTFVYAGTTSSILGESATDRIISMNANIGLGSESSTLNFTIAGDPGSNQWGVPAQNTVGQPVNFTCNGFVFGGLLKSLKNSQDGNGNTTQVTVTCAKELLAKYDILLNKTACPFARVKRTPYGTTIIIRRSMNARNIHADLEFDSINPNACGGEQLNSHLPQAGKDCGSYGKSNEGKVSVGSTTYRAIMKEIGNPAVSAFGGSTVYVDFSPIRWIAEQIPYASTNTYKMTLLDLVNAICDEGGYDFHCSMNGRMITFSLVNKQIETIFGSVKNIIETAKQNNKCISSSIGAESKNEKTQRIVYGSNVNYIKELYLPGNAEGATVLGFNNNFPIYSTYSDFSLPYNTLPLSQSLSVAGFGGFPSTYQISERELIACGTLDTWKLFGLENPASLSRACMYACGLNYPLGVSKIRKYGSLHYIGRSAVEAVKSLGEKTYGANVYEEICWAFFRNIYETYYGKYYLIILKGSNSSTCFQDPTGFIGNSGIYLGEGGAGTLMDTPISSGWPDNENSVLGNSNLQLFFDGSGKLSCFIGLPWNHTLPRGIYSATFDLASFGGDYVWDNQNIYAKCDVDGRVYNINGNMGILVKMPSMITQKVNLNNVVNNNGLRAMSLCYGFPINGTGGGGGTTNTSYANIFKENRAAGGFTKIAIPMKNNQINYGPWGGGSSTYVGGGVDIQVREDLNPWQYGNRSRMDEAGNRIATQGLPYRTRYESGHVTIAESPAESLGSVQAGPLLSSIVVKFDKSGSTTTYNYETYKPKFGNYAENLNEYMKKNVSDRRDNYNILKETYLETVRNANNTLRTINSIREQLSHVDIQRGAGASSASSRQIMISSYPQAYQGQVPLCKIETGTLKAYDSDMFQDSNQYMRYAAVGMDMIFSPMSTSPTNMMAYMSSSYAGPFKMGPTERMPPYLFNGQVQGASHITNFVLNPYTTSAALNSHFAGRGAGYGMQTDYITFGSSIGNMGDVDNFKQQSTDIRGIAHRGPLMLHGWGYDVNGKPVPNQDPSAPNQNFATNWLSNPRTWPVGPVDLRWDATRGVWVSPPSERLIVAQLLSNLSIGGQAEAVIISSLYNDTFSDQGVQFNTVSTYFGCEELSQSNDSYPKITVYDVTARPINVGSRVVCYHVGYGRYIPLMIADTYKKTPSFGCCTDQKKQDPRSPCYENSTESPCKDIGIIHESDFGSAMVEGLSRDGSKYLYDLANILNMPDLPAGGASMQVLGYTGKNSLGLPCMTGIPIVQCVEEDGPGNPPIGDPPCPPGYVRRYPPNGPSYCAGL